MNPCDELEADLELAIETLSERRFDTLIRMLLRIIGFEWLYDLITGNKSWGDLGWEDFFKALVALDIAAAILFLARNLKKLGLGAAAKELLKKLGPWFIAIWVIVLIVEIVVAVDQIIDAQNEFSDEVKQLYSGTDCDEKDAIFTKLDVDIPR